MRVLRSISELKWPTPRVGFVPTMGAFHEGHLSLMKMAKQECGYCVTSLFVNPTQFGPNEDFNRYPRNEERDFALAESAGVDAIFAPDADEVYRDSQTIVQVRGVTDQWEGSLRPGHFDGVATVVAKLFGMVGASDAYFGLKDYQQCRLISVMARDLFLPISLHFCETVREPNGLAMSSRNAYLSPEQKQTASLIYATLQSIRHKTASGADLAAAIADGNHVLSAAGFDVQYLAAVDPNMQMVAKVEENSRLIIAAKLGQIRLIDNIALL